jgi:class 3 adenylate cyclase
VNQTERNLRRIMEDETLFQTKEERRDFTIVLFADLVDSTGYKAKRVFPYGLRKTIRHNHEAQESIQRHGGIVVKHIGDAVMGRFDPFTKKCKPHDSINAAIEFVEKLTRLNANVSEPAEEMHTRIGISSGVCCDFLKGDPQGSSVDLAARLQALAKPDQILIDQRLKETVDVRVLGSIYQRQKSLPGNSILSGNGELRYLRGFRDPVRIYEVNWAATLQGIARTPLLVHEEGFLSFQFLAECMAKAKSRFLATGNGLQKLVHQDVLPEIQKCLKRSDTKFTFVFLNPHSSVVEYCTKMSRTSTKENIEGKVLADIWRLAPMFRDTAFRNRVQLYCSPISNIIPLVLVDETIYTTFPLLADPVNQTNLVNGPYFEIPHEGAFGSRLLSHLKKATSDSYLIDSSYFEQSEAEFKRLLRKKFRSCKDF